jgi:hypothetical protein
MKYRLGELVIFIFFITIVHTSYAQREIVAGAQREFISVCIGFYNVENLFDTINDPNIRDDDFTPYGVNRWNSERYLEKIGNLSKVIAAMGQDMNPDGPAILGVAEVENRGVLEDLANHELLRERDYQVVHYTGPDARGVDVAFMYQPRYFRYISSKAYPTVIEGSPDFRTRDQLLLTGELLGERMHFIVAHWPSRRGGERRSRPLRIALADIARHIIDSIQVAEPDAKVFFMGDLNDNPTDISVRKHLRSKGTREGIKSSELFNPFETLFRRGIGSNAWRDSWSLFDQILFTPSLLGDDFSTWKYYKAEVFNAPFLRQASGRFQGYPFRSYGGGVYLGGYSDHFPTFVFLIREQ